MTAQQTVPPFFSIVLPTFNRAMQLPVAIESILRQTFTSWELLIIDDGSTDNTAEVVESYHDTRIRYTYQNNQERSAARNNGIKQAQGMYVCFLDSDDYYLPEHLASFYKKIQESDCAVAVFYCNTLEDREGKLIPFMQPPVQARNNVERVLLSTLGCPRTCVHHEVFQKHLFNSALSVGEDIDLWVRVLKEFPLIYHAAATVVFVSHPGRTVGSRKSYFATVENLKRIVREDTGFISRAVRTAVLSDAYLRIAQYFAGVNEPWKSVGYSLYALLRYPVHRAKEKIYLMLKVCPLSGWLIRWKEKQNG